MAMVTNVTQIYISLLLLHGEDLQSMTKFLERKQRKYCSHEVQNKFLSILLPAWCRQSSTGKANKEQVVLVFWWVDNALVARMRSLLGSTLQTITSKALLVTVIKATTVMANVITEPALCLVQKGSCKNAVMSLVLFLAIVMGMQHPRKDYQWTMEYALEQVRQLSTTH